MSKIYVVIKGNVPGIYNNWDITKKQVSGFSGAIYKSFTSMTEAEIYCNSYSLKMDKLNKVNLTQESIQDNNNNNLTRELTQGIKSNVEFNNIPDLIIYTDGSCIDKKGGCGILFLLGDNILNEYSLKMEEYPTTNNRAELNAIYLSLFLISQIKEDSRIKDIEIRPDSTYSIDSITSNYRNWSRNGWKTADGRTPFNLDIISKCVDLNELLSKKYNIRYKHVKAHASDIYNNRVDILAKSAVKS